MGARYVLKIKCPMCGYVNLEVYYAPTCGFDTYKCEYCGAQRDIAFALMAGKACEMEEVDQLPIGPYAPDSDEGLD